MIPGIYVGALAVAVLQYLRHRERRLIPLVVLLACLAVAHARDVPRPWPLFGHVGAGLAGLALAYVLAPRAANR